MSHKISSFNPSIVRLAVVVGTLIASLLITGIAAAGPGPGSI